MDGIFIIIIKLLLLRRAFIKIFNIISFIIIIAFATIFN
jgi:hypothetical protein